MSEEWAHPVSDGPAVTRRHATRVTPLTLIQWPAVRRNTLRRNMRPEMEFQHPIYPSACIYFLKIKSSTDSSDTSQCFELIKNSPRWVHEGPGAKGLSGCWGALEPWACTNNANHCLLSRKSAGRAGVAMGDWSDPTFHCGHILSVFIGCKAHTGPTLSPNTLYRHIHSSEELSSVIGVNTVGLSGYLLLLSWYLVTGCKCWQLF